jgi:hypothetical protein
MALIRFPITNIGINLFSSFGVNISVWAKNRGIHVTLYIPRFDCAEIMDKNKVYSSSKSRSFAEKSLTLNHGQA